MMPSFINSLYFIALLGFMSLTQVSQAQECPPTGEMDIPHTNCSIFIKCSNGNGVPQACQANLYFNPVTGRCDYQENVPECVGGFRPEACPPTGQIKIPHTNCSLYMHCDNGHGTLMPCPGDLYFNPEIEQCDFSWNVTECVCGTRPPRNCSLYILCVQGQPILSMCAAGFLFDPILLNCLPADMVDCSAVPVSTTTAMPEFPECPPVQTVLFPYPGNCSLFIICVLGHAMADQCESGMLFDPIELKCKPEDEVDCDAVADADFEFELLRLDDIPNPFHCSKNKEVTKIAVVEDCQSWNECADGYKLTTGTKTCSIGLYFSFNEQNCDAIKPNYCN